MSNKSTSQNHQQKVLLFWNSYVTMQNVSDWFSVFSVTFAISLILRYRFRFFSSLTFAILKSSTALACREWANLQLFTISFQFGKNTSNFIIQEFFVFPGVKLHSRSFQEQWPPCIDKIKETISIEKFDDSKILINANDEFPDYITWKYVVILMTCVLKTVLNFIHN